MSNHFVRLLSLNLLFLLCCLPAVTIPASFMGLNRVMVQLYRNGNCFVKDEFFSEFKCQFLQRTLVVFFLCLLPFSAAFWIGFLGFPQAAAGVLLAVLAVCSLVLQHFAVFSVTLDLPVLANLKNAFYMTFNSWRTSLALLLSSGIFYGTAVFLLPYSVPWLLFIGFSLPQLVACAILYDKAALLVRQD